MATPVPQRDLRNKTAELLRRVEDGERLQITVHGHPVAELGPVETADAFVDRDEVVRDFGGLLLGDDRLEEDLRQDDWEPKDPFA
jgi:prevent-host-death family protein